MHKPILALMLASSLITGARVEVTNNTSKVTVNGKKIVCLICKKSPCYYILSDNGKVVAAYCKEHTPKKSGDNHGKTNE